MLKRPCLRAAILILLLSTLPMSCQFLAGTTATFINSTTFTISTINLGPLTVNGPLGSGLQTGSYSITPGQNALTAQSGGAQTNAVLLTIVAGHSYTVTFNPGATFSQVTVTLAAVN